MRGTFFSRQRAGASKLLRDRRGNAMILTAAAILPIIGIVGSAIDIGRAYMTQLRLQQACDAGVLAGRRAMAGGTYSSDADAEAHKMFNFNFPENIYGSQNIAFSARALDDTADVGGTATAQLPTALMYVFGMPQFNLSANCVAKLEISNTDVMLVLDVTGSMGLYQTADGTNRMTALRDAAKLFFTTMTSAATEGDGRLRFGMVPYASTVNVGEILRKKDASWISDYTLLPSRSAIMKLSWSGGTPNVIKNGTLSPSAGSGSWTNVMPISGFTTSSACTGLTPPGDTMPSTSNAFDATTMNRTARWIDSSDSSARYSDDKNKVHYFYRYKYALSGGKCWLQRQLVTFTQTAAATTAATKSFNKSTSQYRYEDRLFNVSAVKTGGTLTVDTGDNGTVKTDYTWSGCIIERQTSPFGKTSTAPPEALDMDVDTPPTSDEATKWRVYIPDVTHMRAYGLWVGYTAPVYPSKPDTTRGIAKSDGTALIVNASAVSNDGSGSSGAWVSYSNYFGNGAGVCPAAAKNMTTMTAADKSTFDGWIDGLEAVGGTYHDIGMLWGIRLLSPTGLFATENTTVANQRPIQRHIIFMTDGEMAPNMHNFSAQGYEYLSQRVSGSAGTNDTQLTELHNNRFSQLCEIAKDSKRNITIWVIGLGVALNDRLLACASPGNGTNGRRAFQTNDSTELQGIFQSIASQISRLRLSQ